MSEKTREEIVSELRAYKVANPNWITDVEMAKVVASYNNRLLQHQLQVIIYPVNFIVLFLSHIYIAFYKRKNVLHFFN
jgi:hypothetical protein